LTGILSETVAGTLLFNALREAIDEEMARDSNVCVMGEEVGQYGGSYKVTKDLYEKYCDIEGIEQIAVVRNPIDKFFSASTYLITVYGKEIQEKLEDYDEMVSIIENFPMSETLSWWRPQVDFVTDTTHIWKFENGLGTDFGDWLGEKVGVPFEIDKYANYAMNRYEGSFKLDRTPKLIDNICKFWREDIEQFYPELATSF